MIYTRDYLADKALSGYPIGKWKGTEVIPISKEGYRNLVSNGTVKNEFHIIYDDGFKIVKDNLIYGIMDRNGNINETMHDIYIKKREEPQAILPQDSSASGNEMPYILADIDILLKEACAWEA